MVIRVVYPLGQNDWSARDLVVRYLTEQMGDAVKPGPFLIHRLDDPPWGLGDMRTREHFFLGPSVLLPASPGLHVHRAEFPLLEGIVNAHQEAELLLVVRNGKPVLDHDGPGPHEHTLKFRHRAKKFLAL